jgi:hypothetical protein
MSMFKVVYEFSDGEEKVKHKRFYNATNASIAEEMIKEELREGSLAGYGAVIINVKKVKVIEKQ